MIVRVDAGSVHLLEADDLRRFSIAMPDTAAARDMLAMVARLDGLEHAWIAPDRIRALAGAAEPGWAEAFDKTIAYAATKGWTDADGALRAHIVYD